MFYSVSVYTMAAVVLCIMYLHSRVGWGVEFSSPVVDNAGTKVCNHHLITHIDVRQCLIPPQRHFQQLSSTLQLNVQNGDISACHPHATQLEKLNSWVSIIQFCFLFLFLDFLNIAHFDFFIQFVNYMICFTNKWKIQNMECWDFLNVCLNHSAIVTDRWRRSDRKIDNKSGGEKVYMVSTVLLNCYVLWIFL